MKHEIRRGTWIASRHGRNSSQSTKPKAPGHHGSHDGILAVLPQPCIRAMDSRIALPPSAHGIRYFARMLWLTKAASSAPSTASRVSLTRTRACGDG